MSKLNAKLVKERRKICFQDVENLYFQEYFEDIAIQAKNLELSWFAFYNCTENPFQNIYPGKVQNVSSERNDDAKNFIRGKHAKLLKKEMIQKIARRINLYRITHVSRMTQKKGSQVDCCRVKAESSKSCNYTLHPGKPKLKRII